MSRRMRRPLVSGPEIGAIPMVVTGTHNPYLVALSILVASFASYVPLDLGGHAGAARGLARRVWLVAAAITIGGGEWVMQLGGQPTFHSAIPVIYPIGFSNLLFSGASFG